MHKHSASSREEIRKRIHSLRALPETQSQPDRVVAECSSDALIGNYKAIQAMVRNQSMLPMIKANAYGHGAAWAARLLGGLPHLYGLGVATLEEGKDVREVLGPKHRKVSVVVFSGSAPWTEDKGAFCESHRLTPVIASEADWVAFQRGKWPGRVPYHLKFNTGMNRLGISIGYLSTLIKALKGKPVDHQPEGMLSHLAESDVPNSALSRMQLAKFKSLVKEATSAFPGAVFHLGNSAAIWNAKHWELEDLTTVIRPGLSLYGIPPWASAPARQTAPVMSLKARVIATHRLKKGDSLGYGGTFKVSREETVHAAILSMGYADGLVRSLSNQGHAWLEERPTRFIGRVSMDLSSVRAFPTTRVNDWVEVLGPHVDIWAQATAAGTIPYELLTSVSQRVERRYE